MAEETTSRPEVRYQLVGGTEPHEDAKNGKVQEMQLVMDGDMEKTKTSGTTTARNSRLYLYTAASAGQFSSCLCVFRRTLTLDVIEFLFTRCA